jgi:hypothetical protein
MYAYAPAMEAAITTVLMGVATDLFPVIQV